MCFDTDSAPPIPKIAGAAVSHDRLTLQSGDGNSFAAFVAEPDMQATAGVVVLPDVRGLYHFYEELCLRFAERGYAALAFDYFGRTAGSEARDDAFEYMPHVEQTTDAAVQADTRAAVEELRRRGPGRSSQSASASVGVHRGWRPRRATGSPVRSGFTATRPESGEGRAQLRALPR